MEGFLDDVAAYDDEELAEAEDDAASRSGRIQAELTDTSEQEIDLLERMEHWAARYETRPDAKAKELITYLEGGLPPRRQALDERAGRGVHRVPRHPDLAQGTPRPGRAGRRAGAAAVRRDGRRGSASSCGWRSTSRPTRTRSASCSPPTPPARASTCTSTATGWSTTTSRSTRTSWSSGSAASTGTASRQTPRSGTSSARAGRRASDSYEADLEFLARVAAKVARMEEDLGTVNAVLADAVQKRMLGEIDDFDVENAAAPAESGAAGERAGSPPTPTSRPRWPAAPRPRRHRRGAARSPRTTSSGSSTPRSSSTASSRSSRSSTRSSSPRACTRCPPLTKSWARATEGLLEKLEREGEEPRRRPITFDAATAKGRHDIVLAHLGHPLVDMSARLLRAAVWSGHTGLHRVTAVVSDDPALESALAGAYSRFVLVGADGIRLHEEVLYAGGWLREDGTFRRRGEPRRARPHPGPRAQTRARPRRRSSRTGWPRSGPGRGIRPAPADRAAHRRAAHVPAGQAGRPRRRTNAARSSPASTGSPPPCAGRWPRARRRKTRCSAWPKDAATSGRSPSGAGTGRTGRTSSTGWTAARDRELTRVAARYARHQAAQLPGRGDLRRAPPGGGPMSPPVPRSVTGRRRDGAHRLAQADRGQRPVPVRARAHRGMAGPGAAGQRGRVTGSARSTASGRSPAATGTAGSRSCSRTCSAGRARAAGTTWSASPCPCAEHETRRSPRPSRLNDPASGDVRLLGLVSDDSPVARVKGSDWPATPADRLAQLCRAPRGRARAGDRRPLVGAGVGAGRRRHHRCRLRRISWPDSSERVVVRAFLSLLQRRRFFAVRRSSPAPGAAPGEPEQPGRDHRRPSASRSARRSSCWSPRSARSDVPAARRHCRTRSTAARSR